MKHLWKLNHPVLVFWWPYSNLQATQKLRDISIELGIDPDHTFCTGDSVAYCGQPEQTVQFLKDWGVRMILGNTEEQIIADQDNCGCGFESGSKCDRLSSIWYNYAREELSHDSKEYFSTIARNISFEMQWKNIVLVHGSYSDVSQFVFYSTPWDIKQGEFDATRADIIIGWHSGIPFIQSSWDHTWINTWVIGMPANDGTLRGWYVLLIPKTDETIEVQQKSFLYDASTTACKMIEFHLSPEYIETFSTGLWDNCDILPEIETKQQGQKIQQQTILI